jgi:hypothetical protein
MAARPHIFGAIKMIDTPIFVLTDVNRGNQNRRKSASTSACKPDVPQQMTDSIDVAMTVRECVRVSESGKHAI